MPDRAIKESVASLPGDGSPAPGPRYLACEKCDALFAYPQVKDGDSAVCNHCGFPIFTRRPNAIQRSAAWMIAAAVLFVVANFFPFISLRVTGQHSSIVLAQSVGALIDNGSPSLAAAVAIFILGAPALLIAGMAYVLCPLLGGQRLPGACTVARLIYGVSIWDMTEVFMLGVLVSLLKLFHLASVELGIAFYAFAIMIVCITASLVSIGKYELWEGLEKASP